MVLVVTFLLSFLMVSTIKYANSERRGSMPPKASCTGLGGVGDHAHCRHAPGGLVYTIRRVRSIRRSHVAPGFGPACDATLRRARTPLCLSSPTRGEG